MGRELWCEIGLTDPKVSKVHCELTWTDLGRVKLLDAGSKNGLQCNGLDILGVILPRAGGRFGIGDTTFHPPAQPTQGRAQLQGRGL